MIICDAVPNPGFVESRELMAAYMSDSLYINGCCNERSRMRRRFLHSRAAAQ
jgi:hypothetical protein